LRNGTISARELAELSLQRIADSAHLNAFISISQKDECLRQAENADRRLKESQFVS
jgi:Asp-tRNA(Asn)/Glu-tRNA(Gln) amidotransferase A subunit family amidase